MTNKEQGKFLSEIEMIGEQKEFNGDGKLLQEINPANLIPGEDPLKNRRISYNYAFVNCCERYDVPGIDNITDDLWEVWEINEEMNKSHGVGLKILKTLLLQNLNVRWLGYINLTRKYAALLAEGKSWAEFKAEVEEAEDETD